MAAPSRRDSGGLAYGMVASSYVTMPGVQPGTRLRMTPLRARSFGTWPRTQRSISTNGVNVSVPTPSRVSSALIAWVCSATSTPARSRAAAKPSMRAGSIPDTSGLHGPCG
ncbi:hypothetical protein HD597_004664 [Nonomuraea thailandensis]|uniref:Uncharacterized protein n=1 Tax=Nonomuraea thailandensis TaxID=1188745 RepID=A0A9X2GEJ9_9ACTN|nr:hypothetical protein [Nonomuraea thailandensis]MCP2357644.1 hypothetical protein [Nonomuraea thailandensis]